MLAIGACFVTACSTSQPPQGQPQHTGTPMHAIYVLYTLYQKPINGLEGFVGNPATIIVAAMDVQNGKKIWQTALLAVPAVSKNAASSYEVIYNVYIITAGSRIYVVASRGKEGLIAALDAHTGTTIWKHAEETNPIYNVKVVNDTIYMQVGLKTLLVLDGGSGKPLWNISTGNYYTLGSIAITSKAVYIVEQSFGPERRSDPDLFTYTFVRALRLSNGTEMWRSGVDKTFNTVGYQIQADDQRVYLLKPSYESGGENLPGTIVALRAQDGNTLWTYQEPRYSDADYIYFKQTIVEQSLYLVDSSTMTVLDIQNGKQLKTYQTRFHITQFIPKDHMYGLTLNKGEHFCSLNVKDGTKQWCAPVEQTSQIAVGKDNLYFLGYQDQDQGSRSKVMVLRQSDGHVVNQYQIDDPLRTTPGGFAVAE